MRIMLPKLIAGYIQLTRWILWDVAVILSLERSNHDNNIYVYLVNVQLSEVQKKSLTIILHTFR